MDRPPEVRRKQPLEILNSDLLKRCADGDAGVIDDDRDALVSTDDILNQAITLVPPSNQCFIGRLTPQITRRAGFFADNRLAGGASGSSALLDASSGGRQSFPHKHARHISTRSESMVATTDLFESVDPVERNCRERGIDMDAGCSHSNRVCFS